MMDFGSRLRELRTERKLCQKELAKHLSVSVSTISNYENGVHFPDPNTLCKFADYYGVSIDYLLGRTKYRHRLELLDKPMTEDDNVADFINTFVTLETQTQQGIYAFTGYMLQKQPDLMAKAQATAKPTAKSKPLSGTKPKKKPITKKK